jgi:hypothetical protein
MAKDNRDRKAKVRVFYAEVEGGDETIKDGLQSLATALVRAMQPPAPPRPKMMLPPAAAAKDSEPNLFNQNGHPVDEDQVVEAEYEEDEPLEAPAPRQRSGRPRKPRAYTVVSDLNLRPEGRVSLVDFYRAKGPTDQQEQVAVFVYYLSRVLAVTAITDRHVYTCYKEVGERVPPEILQVVRNTARRKGWVDANDPKNLILTVPGENYVEHSLPKAKANGK